jgi:hypothetical protein
VSEATANQTAHRRFNWRVLVGAYVALMSVMALNAIVDPYRVFHIVDWGSGYTDNERYNKVARLIAHPNRHDAFVVGSSRMGLYDPDDLNQLRPGRNYYNLATFGGSAKDALLMLRAIEACGVDIREVVFGIDVFPFMERDGEVTPAYRHHPIASGQSYASFYAGYLMSPSVTHAFLKLQQYRMPEPDLEFDFTGSGRFYLRRWDREIAENQQAYITNTFDQALHEPVRRGVVWNEARFAELQALVQWAERANVQLYLFVQPHHHSELARYTTATLNTFYARIAAIADAIPNYVTHEDWSRNNAWYYEPKHYRPVLAKQVVAALFDNETLVAKQARTLGTGD